MAQAGQELHGPDGYVLRLVSIEPELLQMEATYGGTGQFPPRHYHPSQDEHFEVLEGTLEARIGGEPRTLGAGDSFDVPAGTPHAMWNPGPGEARALWRTSPALETEPFFETMWKLAADGKVGRTVHRVEGNHSLRKGVADYAASAADWVVGQLGSG